MNTAVPITLADGTLFIPAGTPRRLVLILRGLPDKQEDRFTEVLGPLRDLDKWIRRRLRCYAWKQWGPRGYRELRKRGFWHVLRPEPDLLDSLDKLHEVLSEA